MWQTIKSATNSPFMLTMSPAKGVGLSPLLGVWGNAYTCISAANVLTIVGYSLPPDDIEIRTLLRAGVHRGPKPPQVDIRNPAPDVHARIRTLIDRGANSDYARIAPLTA